MKTWRKKRCQKVAWRFNATVLLKRQSHEISSGPSLTLSVSCSLNFSVYHPRSKLFMGDILANFSPPLWPVRRPLLDSLIILLDDQNIADIFMQEQKNAFRSGRKFAWIFPVGFNWPTGHHIEGIRTLVTGQSVLKGHYHEVFDLCFFHESKPPVPWIIA